ncbi:hypothetical protein H310_10338 [Aphanomyces invadans]|uniref:Enoyl-CoA hydratase domain-containing protein 3, mitochondrial n=1 Tax=Aphanomyces invadans TaxID=157072 RepID=A0A024TR73_9STRA|nr:hypothetical protein H310_10338 [Aphanomyces invadans]ETV96655.1 hypothetical protein H310_10338 [Aphanomyces invadans]|eukprot:XP_008874918.1 hypothetical protein H310_10338 [Aphanomyces invadans]
MQVYRRTIQHTMLRRVLVDSGICELTMAHAKSRNALSLELIRELKVALDDIHNDSTIRVVVLAAEGPAFSSGHNLKDLLSARNDGGEDGFGVLDASSNGAAVLGTTFNECSNLMQTMMHMHQPVIAKVNGVATAAGCQLVATCDLAYASQSSKFCTPGVNIGLFCTTPGVALARAVGRKHAMHMLLTGDMIPAADAAAMGLINAAVPDEDLNATVYGIAAKIAGKCQLATRLGKSAFYKQMDMAVPDAYAFASSVMTDNMRSHDAKEGIAAFLNKTTPRWTNQ